MEGNEEQEVRVMVTGAEPVSPTVSALVQDTEAGVVGKERWQEIRRLHEEGRTVSAIARQLELDRKTVRRWLRRTSWAPYC
jgi:DNA invertase Pin-like site-specific DNA recombinase